MGQDGEVDEEDDDDDDDEEGMYRFRSFEYRALHISKNAFRKDLKDFNTVNYKYNTTLLQPLFISPL